MRLHLDSSISGPGDSRTNAVGGAGSSGNSRSAQSGGANDSVALSGTSAILNQAAASRAARIEQISAAVNSGGYKISSPSVASSIVSQAISPGGFVNR